MNDEINKLVHRALGKCLSKDPDCGCIPDDYCNDLNAAFKFVEKLIADGHPFTLQNLTNGNGGRPIQFKAAIWGDKDVDSSVDSSPAKAICLAGLSALGISVSPEEAKRSV